MKSCTHRNFHAQIRRAVSQLLEYRFVYHDDLSDDVTLVIVAEAAPPRTKKWLVDYVRSLGIVLTWRRPGERLLATSVPVPRPLEGIVVQV